MERLYTGILKVIREVFEKRFRRKGGATEQSDPFKVSCQYHSKHKDIKKLEMARRSGDRDGFFGLMHTIAGEGRRTFLSKMRISDTTQLFRYIEKRDGRKPINFTNTCSAPLESVGA